MRGFERNGDIFTIKIMGSFVMMSGKGMRAVEGKFYLHLLPGYTTLTTDIESHLRTLETEGNLSLMSPSCQRNGSEVLEVE